MSLYSLQSLNSQVKTSPKKLLVRNDQPSMIMRSKNAIKCILVKTVTIQPIGITSNRSVGSSIQFQPDRLRAPTDRLVLTCNQLLTFSLFPSSHAFSSTLVLIPFIELDIILTYERRNLESIKSLSPCVILHSFPSRKSPIMHLHFISSSFHHFFLFLATFACTNTFP